MTAADPPLYLGLDLGTSYVKAVACSADGSVVAATAAAYPTRRPRPGWAEQDPDDWWRATGAAAAALMAHPGLAGRRVAAIGLSGQMHGATLLDRGGRPLRPALIWSDGRGADLAAEFAARLAPDTLPAIAGSPPYASATLAKLLWLRAFEPEALARAAHVVLPKDDLRRRLTGVYATDASDASGTLLFDVRARRWSPAILAALGLDAALLPEVRGSAEIAGAVTGEAAAATGLPAGTPVVVGGGDAACAAYGVGLGDPAGGASDGDALVSIGTAGQLFAVAAAPAIDPAGRVQTLCCVTPHAWAVVGAILSGGDALAWLAHVAGAPDAGALLAAAAPVPPGAEGLLFLPYLAGERSPHMDPDARGAFVGLAAPHTRAHLARAAVEGVAFALRDCLEALRTLGVAPARLLLAGGVARDPLWPRVLADALGVPILTGGDEHGSARGAARLAARGAGDVAPLAATARTRTDPDPAAAAAYERVYALYRPLYAALRPISAALAGHANTRP